MTTNAFSRRTYRFAPGLQQYRHYERKWLRGDVVAGVTVAAYLIPQVMAYATVAGLPPATGLWAAIGPIALYAVLGSSRQLSVGPESTTALMTAVVLGPLAAADPDRYARLAAVLALIVGAICLLARLARLGLLADLLSRPVLVGYMAGIAFMMIASQLGKVTGLSVHSDSFVGQVRSFFAQIDHVHWPTVALFVAVLAVLLLVDRISPHLPGPLIGILLATGVVALFSLQDSGIRVVGEIPSGLPVPGIAAVDVGDISALFLPAIGIAIVAFSDNVLTARAFAIRTGDDIDPNTELGALGAGNVAAGLLQGFPISSSGSRTAIGASLGSRTQLYSIVALATVLGTIFTARGILAVFPSAALGALVIYAATRLIDLPEFRRIGHFRVSELALALITTVAVLTLDVLYGVVVAVALSIFDLLRRVARPHDGILGYVPGVLGMHDVDDYPTAARVPGLVVYRYDAPLCFANADNFRRRALAAVDEGPQETRWFVLNAEANVEVDLTALDALDQLRADLERRGIIFGMARVKQDLRSSLIAAGLLTKIGEDRIFMTLPGAVDAYRKWAAELQRGDDDQSPGT
ncbi:SulP family inorganic anion transporter [Antrihabitans sp. YC2-6]|uniref:SulP family inorganic anion transporter n=1 Tax=Antrihabitans sp. YC2-6 TaxID=2799498 RepID=UPI0018F5B06C|nr:sulfate permease [Antrihabitans sp. YC2-6]MBJ8347032.1 sulfate permease [Antrihabitans sp. YC2-6]